MADSTPKSYHTDPTLYMYTSLTSGSSQIITATSRLQTILKANKIEFQALDIATDEKARMLWGRRRGNRKLPGLVRYGMVVGDIDEVEEWNEYGELKDQLKDSATVKPTPTPSAANTPSKPPINPKAMKETAPETPKASKETNPEKADSSASNTAWSTESNLTSALRQAGIEAAKKATDAKSRARAEALESSKKISSTLGAGESVTEAEAPSESSNQKATPMSETTKPQTTEPEPKVLKDRVEANAKPEQHIPSAKEADESANNAIIEDESHHIHIAGSPPPVKRANLAERARAEGDKAKAKSIEEAPERDLLSETKQAALQKNSNTTLTKDENTAETDVETEAKPVASTAKEENSQEDNKTSQGKHPAEDTTKVAEKSADKATGEEFGVNSLPSREPEPPIPSPAKPSTAAAIVTEEAKQPSPQTKTQEQPAASGEHVGQTVAD